MRRGSARARVRRATAAAWDTLTMHRAPLQVRARAAGADRRRAGSTRAAGPAHAAKREGAAAREERRSGQGNAHAGVTHACRVRRAVKGRRQRRQGSGVNRAQEGFSREAGPPWHKGGGGWVRGSGCTLPPTQTPLALTPPTPS